ncbi:MAG: cbb3-type cytochrome c oxidase subunit II [Bacteroidota bacterium]
MTRSIVLFVGVIAAVLMSYTGLSLLPGLQLFDIEPTPGTSDYTFEEAQGRAVYIRDGCIYCHSQQIRPENFGADIARGWAPRPTKAGDYLYDDPHLLGTSRTGPDLSDIASRQPSWDWHMAHFYNPRAVSPGSVMPAYPFYFDVVEPGAVLASQRTVPLPAEYTPPDGKVVVAKEEVEHLYAYLMALRVEPLNAE